MYTYTYYHPQTDCFVVSQLFSVVRHVGCFKLGLKRANFMLNFVSYQSAISQHTSAQEL